MGTPGAEAETHGKTATFGHIPVKNTSNFDLKLTKFENKFKR